MQNVTVVVQPTRSAARSSVAGGGNDVPGHGRRAGGRCSAQLLVCLGAPSWLSIDAGTGDISGIIPEGSPGYYTYQVVATDSDGSATSKAQVVTIDQGDTTVSVQSSAPETVLVGTQVTYTATVSETEGSGALTGLLSFMQNKSSVSSCQRLDSLAWFGQLLHHLLFRRQFQHHGQLPERPVLLQLVGVDDPTGRRPAGTAVHVCRQHHRDRRQCVQLRRQHQRSSYAKGHGSGSLPSGVSFAANPGGGSATISGTPAAGTGGTYAVTLKASNSAGPTTQSFVLSVDQPAGFTSAAATTTSVGTALSFKVTTSGYPAASLSESGSLPSGVTFSRKSNGTATLTSDDFSGGC